LDKIDEIKLALGVKDGVLVSKTAVDYLSKKMAERRSLAKVFFTTSSGGDHQIDGGEESAGGTQEKDVGKLHDG
jgi:hypothetical protein